MTQIAEAILQLHPSSRQTGKITALTLGEIRITQGVLHKAIHPTPPFVLTIGQHGEGTIHRRNGFPISNIHAPYEGILHQLHADPIEVLHDQQIVSTSELLEQLVGLETGHQNSAVMIVAGTSGTACWHSWPRWKGLQGITDERETQIPHRPQQRGPLSRESAANLCVGNP